VDRLVLLVPTHAVALVPGTTDHLDDLAEPRRSATDDVNGNPVAAASRSSTVYVFGGHARMKSPST
jgi:hypothetical protein